MDFESSAGLLGEDVSRVIPRFFDVFNATEVEKSNESSPRSTCSIWDWNLEIDTSSLTTR